MDLPSANNKAAQDRIASVALSLFEARGYPVPGSDVLGGIVLETMAGLSAAELRNPDGVSASVRSKIEQLVASSAEVGRPRNIYSAEAARDAQLAGLPGRSGLGLDALEAMRGGSRYREINGESRYSGLSASASGGTQQTSAEYLRAYAGAGASASSVQAFAAVGLDRGTFDGFRREGYSVAQIADNARDMRVLHFQGKEEAGIAMHAPTDLRKAAVAVEKAPTAEAKAKAQADESAKASYYAALPDSDPRKAQARQFIERLEAHGHHVNREVGAGRGMTQDDSILRVEHAEMGTALGRAQDRNLAAGRNQSVAAITGKDDLGETPDPAPVKPALTRAAALKQPVSPRPSP